MAVWLQRNAFLFIRGFVLWGFRDWVTGKASGSKLFGFKRLSIVQDSFALARSVRAQMVLFMPSLQHFSARSSTASATSN